VARSRARLEPGFDRTIASLAMPALVAAAGVVAEGQRRRIPVSRDGSHGRQPGYARSKIRTEVGRDGQGPYADAGTFDDALSPEGYNYPVGLELGTRPHTITSHGDYPLRSRDGRIFGRSVQHPGTKPYPWCRAALGDIAGKVF
jgi:hypothetical protein